jgi:hypothetical protein
MRKLAIIGLFVLAVSQSHAQSKVFKEVSEDMSSQILTIQQDNLLVGYLAFTQLEKTNKDSFNYRLTIMDENLNDIGVVNFRQEKLILQAASFEQDVLCLAYLKSNLIGKEFRNGKALEKAEVNGGRNSVFFQFLDLQGTIVKTHEIIVDISLMNYSYGSFAAKGNLETSVQIKNIPQQGFVCYYADLKDKNILAFDLAGNKTWANKVKEESVLAAMVNAGQEAYLLMKKRVKMDEGGYELIAYNTVSGKQYPKQELKDKKGQFLKVLCFGLDPTTGRPFISGNIIDSRMGNKYIQPNHLTEGTYAGVFTINVNGPEKNGLSQQFSYWNDGSQAAFNKMGYYVEQKKYARLLHSFRDQEGNTYFAGSSFIRKPKIGSIIATIVTAPIVIPAIAISMGGFTKIKTTDAVLVKQDAKGNLTVMDNIEWTRSRFRMFKVPIAAYDRKSFYSVSNADTKNSHLILDDSKKIIIYNLKKHKEERSIKIKEGNIRTNVIPAKEGHIMISEYDSKEKTIRISIESL